MFRRKFCACGDGDEEIGCGGSGVGVFVVSVSASASFVCDRVAELGLSLFCCGIR